MKKHTLVAVTLLFPFAVQAQGGSASGAASASARTSADVKVSAQHEHHGAASKQASTAGSTHGSLSAESQARVDAMVTGAKKEGLPTEPMERRAAEGQAKGATDAAIIASVSRVKANLEASHSAIVSGGRTNPSSEEVERGASAMERGVSVVELQALAQHAPTDRSLVVALDVLAHLTTSGVVATDAVALIQGKLEANASDASLASLVSVGAMGNSNGAASAGSGVINAGGAVNGAVNGQLGGGQGSVGTAGSVGAGVTGVASGAVGGAGAAGGVTGGVTGTVGGVIGKKN